MELIPIGVVIATGLLAIITYAIQKVLDRRSATIELKRERYTVFLQALVHHMMTMSEESHLQYSILANEFPLYASDEVIQELSTFLTYCGETAGKGTRTDAEMKRHWSELLLAMRKDCFGKVDFSARELAPLLTFTVGRD